MNKKILLAALLLCSAPLAQAEERAMLVLDASGSMWGQIEGKAKIDIAREALKTLVADWPANRSVGLVAYGHRQKDDCNDIETLLPAGAVDAARIGKIVDGLTPKGKTPLSAAVKHAAEALKYTEEKATVILISDGVETCNLDPCALGTELEKLGVDFTAHVIGFDVAKVEDQQGLRCLAENTGGKFISAANAGELKTALEQTAKAPEPEPQPAPEPEKQPQPPVLPKATLTVTPAETIKGAEIEVKVEGDAGMAKNADMHIELFMAGKNVAVNHQYLYQDKKSGGYKSARFRMPNVTGDFVVRLAKGDHREWVAEAAVKVIEAEIKLVAPAQAAPGSKVEVKLDAPLGLKGDVRLYPQNGEKSVGTGYVREDAIENYKPMKFTLPEVSGAYVFKFEAKPDKKVMAELPIQIGETQP
ncbi:MAG: VWA domain-containing protein [Gammaproteobacteria bacterium]|nr:VWA domain-containing protein [Gammaproteobacteria bacterium]MBU1724224.1 VWA domain-containing protein [Gammaproteobacteria bacterium]MBU2007178.1 VWA domain-containing protein [Gammaproteobacteria bacterium]